MENASKALLIAGAVLIVILLIGVGMLIYNSSMGSVNEAISQMSSQEKDMFNAQFTQYEGTRVNGANVRALINKVNSSNLTNEAQDASAAKHVELSGITETKNVNTAKPYSVTCEVDAKSGLVNKVVIEEVK